MGMAASQARLLSITARLTNNENTGQSVSYSKQRLADQTQQITNEYNEALSATKLTVLTGFNGAEATYSDISYNLMTGLQMAENTKQYVVTDTKGRILVTENLADAYSESNGNYNQFLANLGYSQVDINVQKTYKNDSEKTTQQADAEQKIHEAWDKYFATVGINLGDNEHDFGFSWTETIAAGGDINNQNDYAIGQGYAGYLKTNEDGQPVDADGNVAYITNASGVPIDKNDNEIYTDAYTQETIDNAASIAYIDPEGNIVTSPNTYSDAVKQNYTARYYNNGTQIAYDTYSEETIKNATSVEYKDADGNVLSFDYDSDGDGTVDSFTYETQSKIARIECKNAEGAVIAKDAYSDTVKNNSNYELKYVDSSNTPIPYDAYSDDLIVNKCYDADGNEIAYDDYKDETKEKLQYDESKFIYEPINYEGTTQESRDLFDYAMAITEAYLRTNDGATTSQYHLEYDPDLLQNASNAENTSILKYYKNIFTKMQSSGYFTYTTTAADAARDPEHYIYASVGTGTAGNVQKSPLKDNVTFENALRDGTLRLEYYSTTDKGFVSTTISEDNCIQEVADERAIAAAESKYNQDMTDLENKDKKLDLELKKLDTEHSALQTEYDSVKNVVDKNVEASFKTFG